MTLMKRLCAIVALTLAVASVLSGGAWADQQEPVGITAFPATLPPSRAIVSLTSAETDSTNWMSTSQVTFSGDGIVINSITQKDSHTLLVDLTVASEAAVGPRDVTVTTPVGYGTETDTASSVFTVTAATGDPRLLTAQPSRIVRSADAVEMTIDGVNTAFSDADSLDLGEGVIVREVTVVSPERIVAKVYTSSSATLGPRTLRVGALTLEDVVSVEAAPATTVIVRGQIAQRPTPGTDRAWRRTEITLYGENFDLPPEVTISGSDPIVGSVGNYTDTRYYVLYWVYPTTPLGFRDVTLSLGRQVVFVKDAIFIEEPDLYVITAGPTISSDTVASGGEVDVSIEVEAASGRPITYTWTDDCGDSGLEGEFVDAAAPETRWIAPVNNRDSDVGCEVKLGVHYAPGKVQNFAFDVTVLAEPNRLTITAGPSVYPGQVLSGGQVGLSVTVESNWIWPILYDWTQSCPGGLEGTFADPQARETTWTAPAVSTGTVLCTLSLVARGDRGGDTVGDSVMVTVGPAPTSSTHIFANILPSSRIVRNLGCFDEFGFSYPCTYVEPTTVFASIVNAGSVTAVGCSVSLASSLPVTFTFQPTDPATNAAVGIQGQAVDIPPGGSATFVLGFAPTMYRNDFAEETEFIFDCMNSEPAPTVPYVNTVWLRSTPRLIPDVIAIVASLTNDGIALVPGPDGLGFFTVAGVNIGLGGDLYVEPTPIDPDLPVSLSICETTGTSDGSCLADPTDRVQASFPYTHVATFTVFVKGNGTAIPVDFASSRVRVIFFSNPRQMTDLRGSTSIAVQTAAPTGALALH